MTHFSWLVDGSIVGLYLLATMVAGVMVRRYVGKVEHFLVAGREMNAYLGIASLAATEFGIVTCMYTAQNGYRYGFAGTVPGILQALAMFIVGATGFCIKPLRDAGVITIPEMLEKRFGPRIRWASGVVIVLGGLLNMGVFLRTGGEFLVQVCGFDPRYLEIVMTVLLVAVAAYTVLGGMLSVLVTDFLQFVVMSVGLLAVTVLILVEVGWDRLVGTVRAAYGSGGFNPFAHACCLEFRPGQEIFRRGGCVRAADNAQRRGEQPFGCSGNRQGLTQFGARGGHGDDVRRRSQHGAMLVQHPCRCCAGVGFARNSEVLDL